MIKTLATFLTIPIAIMASVFVSSNSTISVRYDMPEKIIAGKEILVNVKLQKGNLAGFARFQQVLPLGFTAMPESIPNARFETEGNIVKVIWMSLPFDQEINFSYRIFSTEITAPEISIPTTFSYIENEITRKSELSPLELKFETPDNARPEVTRKIYVTDQERGEYKVELTIVRRNETRSARFVEMIREGYDAEPLQTAGAIFTRENNIIRFAWDALPSEPVFNISYSLKTNEAGKKSPQVSGMLVYGNPNEHEGESNNSNLQATKTTIEENLLQQQHASENPKPLIAKLPAPQKGLYYTVQVAATQKSPVRDNHFFQTYYHIPPPVEMTEHEGWRKYMVGNFPTYETARSRRNAARESVADAFVVAYYDGKRITVQEALHISKKTAN